MSNSNYFVVQFNSNPASFEVFSLTLYRDLSTYFIYMYAQFVSGGVSDITQVQVGATVEESVANLAAFLQNVYGSDPNLFITSNSNVINFEFVDQLDYLFMGSAGNDVDFTVFVSSSNPPVFGEELDPLSFKDISISIIDTYENDLPMIVEFPQEGVCELSWNGGDDLIKEIVSSELNFNMLVPGRQDAHFLHLLTTDENRYLVKVEGINEDEQIQLIWQGFLLPDQYREPYTTGALFVDFSATDNLGTLKGKYFDPWVYQNRFPLPELLGMILEKTGLEQSMIFKPSIIPAASFIKWEHINVDLKYYVKDKELKDIYIILKDVLEGNLLTLKSFRGFWWIEGLTRKKDASGAAIVFDNKGRYFGNINFTKSAFPLIVEEGSAYLGAITPYKKVNYEWAVDGNKNMFSEYVVKIPQEKIFKSYNYGNPFSQPLRYVDLKFKEWDSVLNGDCVLNPNNHDQLRLGIAWTMFYGAYNYNEAMALQNYIECPEIVYVKPGVLYSFEMEFYFGYYPSSDQGSSSQVYNNMIPFQIFVNDIEIMSNRPGFSEASRYSYVVKNAEEYLGYPWGSRFNLKTDLRVEQEGSLKIRILVPITGSLTAFQNSWFAEKLELKAAEGYSENENIIAVRDINFTNELDYSVKIGVSQDVSIKNSMGLGLPYNFSYFRTVRNNYYTPFSFTTDHKFQPSTVLELNWEGSELEGSMYKTLFQEGWSKSAFIKKESGETFAFDNLWGSWAVNEVKKVAFLTSYEGNPVIPKNYFAFTDFEEGDGIYIMQVRYPSENYLNRLNWKVYNSSIINQFNKVLVSAIHSVRPETIFRLECDVFRLVFPEDLPWFYFDGEDRNFIPTTLKLDLYNGKTSFVGTEGVYKEFTDLIFE